METKINIADILKDKPVGLKFYSNTFGYISFNGVHKDKVYFFSEDTNAHSVKPNGKMYNGGECIIFPSKEMRDWEKFSWKKGDILVSKDNVHIIFEKFEDDTYTRFKGKHYLWKEFNVEDYNKEETKMLTSVFEKAADDVAQTYIKTIEEHLGGKLNLDTLEIEKTQPEFKDGDIVCISGMGYLTYGIVKSIDNSSKKLEYYVLNDMSTLNFEDWLSFEDKQIQPITETQQIILFDALAKDGKAWDADKKAMVDLPKKCEFKAMDWCLMRDKKETWKLCQFSFFDDGDYEAPYNAVGGNWFDECIPYNEETKHLLGTTDEWKGGEG